MDHRVNPRVQYWKGLITQVSMTMNHKYRHKKTQIQCYGTIHGRSGQTTMYYLCKTLFRIKLTNFSYLFYDALELLQVREGLRWLEEETLFYIKSTKSRKKEKKCQQSLDSYMWIHCVKNTGGRKQLLKCSADWRVNVYNQTINKHRVDPP